MSGDPIFIYSYSCIQFMMSMGQEKTESRRGDEPIIFVNDVRVKSGDKQHRTDAQTFVA